MRYFVRNFDFASPAFALPFVLIFMLSVATVAMGVDIVDNITTYLNAQSPEPATSDLPSMQPCVEEDGSGGSLPCFWDAQTRGNGIGRSFWIDSNGEFHYADVQ